MSDGRAGVPVVDAHVHFWHPGSLDYPWLAELPALNRPFLPEDFSAATEGVPVEKLVFVECNPRPEQSRDEVGWIQQLREAEPRIAGIVAFADLLNPGLQAELDWLADVPLVRGIRHNIQGNPAGFCLQPAFVEGVRGAGRRGLSFDLCATHDQLGEVAELARRCPGTRLVLDHCGKPAIALGTWEPWATHMDELADCPHVWCKLSGLATEADPAQCRDEDLLPFAEIVADRFGVDRLMYGSDWPVLTRAADYATWYVFALRVAAGWGREDARKFFHDNAIDFYGL